MTKNNLLFIYLQEDNFFLKQIEKKGYHMTRDYRKLNLIGRGFRRFLIKNKKKVPTNFFDKNWVKKVHEYNTFFVFDSLNSYEIIRFINKHNPQARVILYYWNPVSKSVKPDFFNDLKCEIWSFDESDCKKYSLRYNSQFYFKELVTDINLPASQDAFFIGNDKNRMHDLMNLKSELNKQGVSTKFHVIPNAGKVAQYSAEYSRRIDYFEVVENITRSAAIIDIVQTNQTGLTLRPLEAIFFKKKLITNDKNIKERDFYNKKNIFILGCDNINNIKKFINSPYEKIPDKVVKNYDFDSWIEKFNI